jgi:hypothetical protein
MPPGKSEIIPARLGGAPELFFEPFEGETTFGIESLQAKCHNGQHPDCQ